MKGCPSTGIEEWRRCDGRKRLRTTKRKFTSVSVLLVVAQHFRHPFQADAGPADKIVGTNRSPSLKIIPEKYNIIIHLWTNYFYRLMGMIGIFSRLHLLQLLVLTLSTLALLTMPSGDWDVSVCVGGRASASEVSAKEVRPLVKCSSMLPPTRRDGPGHHVEVQT